MISMESLFTALIVLLVSIAIWYLCSRINRNIDNRSFKLFNRLLAIVMIVLLAMKVYSFGFFSPNAAQGSNGGNSPTPTISITPDTTSAIGLPYIPGAAIWWDAAPTKKVQIVSPYGPEYAIGIPGFSFDCTITYTNDSTGVTEVVYISAGEYRNVFFPADTMVVEQENNALQFQYGFFNTSK